MQQRGLGKRMQREARRMASQHRQLLTLHELIVGALEAGQATDARAKFARFCDALEAHFSLEDGFYFPAVRGLHPDLDAELSALSRDHERFRELLSEVWASFDAGDLEACGRGLERTARQLEQHEANEERLIARVHGGRDRAAG